MAINPQQSEQSPALGPAQRIYGLKITIVLLGMLILTILLFVGDGLAVAHPQESWSWFRRIPWEALGSAALSVVLIAFGYEWYVRRESREELDDTLENFSGRLRAQLAQDTQRALVMNPQLIKELMNDSMIDQIVLAGLERKVGDALLARESYENLLAQLLGYDRKFTNYRCKITMTPISKSYDDTVSALYYEAYVDLRYDTQLLRTDHWFTAVNTIEEYNRLLLDPAWELRCVRPPTRTFPAGDERAFTLHFVRINGTDLAIGKGERDGFNGYVARQDDLANLVGNSVTFEYRYSTKIEKTGHVYMQNVIVPTKNVAIEFDYSLVDIGRVNVFDFFVSRRKPSIKMTRSPDDPRSVGLELDDWVFPKSGALFSWVLSSEMAIPYPDALARRDAQESSNPRQISE